MKKCDLDSETIGIACVIALVLVLVLIRACIPLNMHHPSERPLTPPESLYQTR